jgi:hypothetical protein
VEQKYVNLQAKLRNINEAIPQMLRVAEFKEAKVNGEHIINISNHDVYPGTLICDKSPYDTSD